MALGEVEVGVADACRRDAHEHFARARFRELHLLDDEGCVRLVED
jgi:hypothetical protein